MTHCMPGGQRVASHVHSSVITTNVWPKLLDELRHFCRVSHVKWVMGYMRRDTVSILKITFQALATPPPEATA